LADFGFTKERCHEVMLAVDEACTNAMRHSYDGRTNEMLVLSLRSNADWVEIELRDEGRPAPPEKTCRKTVAPPDPESLRPGGLGVQLIYEVFDEVTFTPGEREGNCVSMRLRKPDDSR
jgi:anti-sigma regulatory factor (Ser/Thr protein kinase)